MIKVDGKSHKVVESLGYNPDVGAYVKVILVDGVERVVVGTNGCWRFWEPIVMPVVMPATRPMGGVIRNS